MQLSTRLAGYPSWPGLAQVCRRERTTVRGGKRTVEVDYAISSLTRQRADAAAVQRFWRGHWGIENRVHYIRDVAFGEDHCRVRKGSAPQILAAVRNAAINLLRQWGCKNIAAALRQHAYQPRQLLAKLGLLKQ